MTTFKFNTAKEYSEALVKLQNEQKELMKGNMRLKKNRIRKQEINAEFFAIKKDWRNNPNVDRTYGK